jgi:hypothetical protein
MEAKNYLDLKCQMKKNGNSWEFITNLPSFIGSYKFCMKPNFIGLYKNHMNYVLWLIWMIFVHIQYLNMFNTQKMHSLIQNCITTIAHV